MKYVLLVEDDQDDIDNFKEALLRVNRDTVLRVAFNGVEALNILENSILKPNIIFTDINMPIMDGISMAKFIKKSASYRDIPVVLLSTAPASEDVEFANHAFIKPIAIDDLCIIIGSVLSSLSREQIT